MITLASALVTTGLDALIAGSPAACAAGIDEANAAIATHMQELVHVGPDTPPHTHTITTITAHPAETAGTLITGEVTAGGAAVWLELGWHARNGRPVGPFPFMLPAFDMVAPSVPDRIAARYALLMSGATGAATQGAL